MLDPMPDDSPLAPASEPPPANDGMRRPRRLEEDDDKILTAKRSYVPMDAREQDTEVQLLPAPDLLSATATGEPRTGTPAEQAQWLQALNEALMDAVELRLLDPV